MKTKQELIGWAKKKLNEDWTADMITLSGNMYIVESHFIAEGYGCKKAGCIKNFIDARTLKVLDTIVTSVD